MLRFVVVAVMLVATLYSASAALVPELSDDFNDGNYSFNLSWSETDYPTVPFYVEDGILKTVTSGINTGIYITDQPTTFGADEFRLEFYVKSVNHTSAQDCISPHIGDGAQYQGEYPADGYSLSVCIDASDNCYWAIDKQNGGVYGGSVYYNLTWFNDVGLDCKTHFVDSVLKRNSSGHMTLQFDGITAWEGQETSEASTSWDSAYISYTVTALPSKFEVDNFSVFTDVDGVVLCVEDWLPQYANSSCNGTFIVEHKTYYDNASCGTYVFLPVDNGSVSATFGCGGCSGYCAEYTSSDFFPIVVDGFANAGVSVVGLIGVIVVVLLAALGMGYYSRR